MALPASAEIFTRTMDPSDLLPWSWSFTKGDGEADLIDAGAAIAEFTLAPSIEAAAVGLTVRADGAYAPTLDDTELVFFPEVAMAQRNAAIFDNGINLGVEFTGWTNQTPPQRVQRTIGIKVIDR